MVRKTTVRTLQATNKQNVIRENLNMANKGNFMRETESLFIAAQNNTQKTMSKEELTRPNKIAGVDYVVIERKR